MWKYCFNFNNVFYKLLLFCISRNTSVSFNFNNVFYKRNRKNYYGLCDCSFNFNNVFYKHTIVLFNSFIC